MSVWEWVCVCVCVRVSVCESKFVWVSVLEWVCVSECVRVSVWERVWSVSECVWVSVCEVWVSVCEWVCEWVCGECVRVSVWEWVCESVCVCVKWRRCESVCEVKGRKGGRSGYGTKNKNPTRQCGEKKYILHNTVDGSEIRITSWKRWFVPLFIGFQPRWCRISQPSTVLSSGFPYTTRLALVRQAQLGIAAYPRQLGTLPLR